MIKVHEALARAIYTHLVSPTPSHTAAHMQLNFCSLALVSAYAPVHACIAVRLWGQGWRGGAGGVEDIRRVGPAYSCMNLHCVIAFVSP